MKIFNLPVILLGIILFFITGVHAQVVTIDYILTDKVTFTDKVKIPETNVILLETGFGEYKINSQALIDSIKSKAIDRIDIVYTDYNKSKTFSQPELNFKRLEYLKEKIPFIFDNNLIEWGIICQTGATSGEEAKNYYHGFIVHLKKNDFFGGIKSTEEELAFIKKMCDKCLVKPGDTIRSRGSIYASGKPLLTPFLVRDSIIKIPRGKFKGKFIYTDPSKIKSGAFFQSKQITREPLTHTIPVCDTVLMETLYSKRKKVLVENSFVPRSKKKAKKKIIYDKKGIWMRKPLYLKKWIKDTVYVKTDTMFVLLSSDFPVLSKDCYDRMIGVGSFEGAVVLRVMDNLKDLENYVVVEDVTGSMYPYLAQTFLWRRKTLSSSTLSRFVFFNDGDNKSDYYKKIGETGGIYPIDNKNIDSIEYLAQYAMMRGSGGDCPENNLEALIRANELYPQSHLIMIADNNAPIKDLILIEQIGQPVDVILCGVQRGRIQSDYLTLVKKVGGTIFTMEKELRDLIKLNEGDFIEFGGQKFNIIDGRFILTR